MLRFNFPVIIRTVSHFDRCRIIVEFAVNKSPATPIFRWWGLKGPGQSNPYSIPRPCWSWANQSLCRPHPAPRNASAVLRNLIPVASGLQRADRDERRSGDRQWPDMRWECEGCRPHLARSGGCGLPHRLRRSRRAFVRRSAVPTLAPTRSSIARTDAKSEGL